MNKLHEMIDKLIEVRVSSKLSPEANHNMDLVIETLIEEANTVPDWNNMTPEEIEEMKYFEAIIKDMIEHRLAMAWLQLSTVTAARQIKCVNNIGDKSDER